MPRPIMLLKLLVMAVGAPLVALAASSEGLRTCFENVLSDRGSFAFAGDLFYDRLVNRYNLNIPITPAALAFPT